MASTRHVGSIGMRVRIGLRGRRKWIGNSKGTGDVTSRTQLGKNVVV